jgi:glutamate-ammonia-ligase adenylyltransferase
MTAKDLLLASQLDREAIIAILRPYGFTDPLRADANLQSMAEDPRVRHILSQVVDHLLLAVGSSSDPDQSLDLIERFAKSALNEVQLFSYLSESPRTIDLLALALGASPFMAEILIRDPGLLYWVSDPRVLELRRSHADMARDLASLLSPLRTHERRLDALRIFKRRELLHIGVRDLLRLSSVEGTLDSLSSLADVLIAAALESCTEQVIRGHARHDFNASKGVPPAELVVIGMGKLGGSELNFSSDVDLMFVSGSDSGSRALREMLRMPVPEFHQRLARSVIAALSETTSEGYVYRVDLRLRPEGEAGNVVSSLSTFREYYADRAETWERLSLVKARPVAGDLEVGLRFMQLIRPFVYRGPLDAEELAAMRDIKARIDRKVAALGQSHRHVKLGFGGIREIEFVVQALQASHGDRLERLRERGTLRALRALGEARLISLDDRRALIDAYVFMRDVENKLQMVLDVQVHALPSDAATARRYALRLGYRDTAPGDAGQALLTDYQRHTQNVNRIFQRIFSARATES